MDEVANSRDLAAQAGDRPVPSASPPASEHADVAGHSAADAVGDGQPPSAVEAPPPAAAAEGPQPSPEPGKPRRLLYVTLPGCWGALIAGCLSFTPSLLPRGGIVQGLVWGITAAIGYGLGVLAAWIWRAFADREPRRPRRRSWPVFFISAAVLVVVSFGLGQYWQYEIRKLMGVTDYSIPLVIASPFVAAAAFCLLLLIGRGLRGLYRWAAQLLNRWIGRRAAHAVGWILVAGLAYLVVSGLLLQGFVNVMNSAYSVRDTTTAEGIHQPTTSLRSGGPGSVIPWDSLGWQGRNFIGKGPSVSDIEKFTGQPAMEPIRVYAGLASGPDAQSRAALAVKDLERAGAFRAQEPARGDDDRQRLGRPGAGGHVRVPVRRGLGDGGDPVLLPAVVDLLPGRPVQGPRGGPRAVRRGLWRLVAAAPRPASQAVRGRGKPGVIRRRDRLQRRIQHGQPDLRRAVRRAAQLQHAVPGIQRPPRRWQPGGPARLPRRADRTVRQRPDHGNSAERPAVGRQPGPVPDAPVRPDRLVEPASDLQRAGLDQRASRQGRAQGHVLAALS